MKWLQWSYLDIENGAGGVEVHIRNVNRELQNLGVDAHFSMDPHEVLSGSWDVIHTHGSNVEILTEWRARLKNRFQGSPVWVHTLHGLTHERMLACGEFFWPGGYRAIGRELAASLSADVLLTIHPNLSLYKILEKTSKKKTAICGNGWDSWSGVKEENLNQKNLPKDFWLYVGRAEDKVKGADYLISAWNQMPQHKLVAVPGEGFDEAAEIIRAGSQSPSQVRALLHRARGLILTSLHEGLPLVVLEALGEGTPVVATSVGGIKMLSSELQGLLKIASPSPENIKRAVEDAQKLPVTEEARLARAHHNRKFLKTWRQVAQTALSVVKTP